MSRGLLLSCLSSILFFISWPPFNGFTFLIFIAFIPLFIIENDLKNKRISITKYFFCVYLTFFLFNLFTTWWIHNAHLAGAIFAISCNAFFMTMVLYITRLLATIYNWNQSLLLLPLFWVSFEYLHFNWDLSWPWLSLGNVFSSQTNLVQWYSYTGTLGGTLWVLFINVLLYKIGYLYFNNNSVKREFVLLLSVMIFPMYLSHLLLNYSSNSSYENHIETLVVQPNFDPYSEKYDLNQEEQIRITMQLIEDNINDSIEFVLLPESFLIAPIWERSMDNNLSIKQIKDVINKYSNLNMVLGSTTLALTNRTPVSKPLNNHNTQWYEVYNSAILLNGVSTDIYHKSKLVPGAEKMPFIEFLSPILGDGVLQIGGSYSVGNFGSQDTVSVFKSTQNNKIAPVICYESIYPNYVRKFINKGAQVIFIITNDGWWKDTSGYKQHNMYAKLRAIETGRYIARSANTGISSIINNMGVVEKQIKWDERGIINYTIPLIDTMTFYVKHGDFLGRLSVFLSVILILCSIVFNKLRFSR